MKRALPVLLLATAAISAPPDEDRRALARHIADADADVRAAHNRAALARAAERMQAARLAETRKPLVGMTAALARIARRPLALALAGGSDAAHAAHLGVLTRYMRDRIARENVAISRELALRTALRKDASRALAQLVASRRLLAESTAPGPPLSGSRDERAVSKRLAALPGPTLSPDAVAGSSNETDAGLYRLPGFGQLLMGMGEHGIDGARARGITLATAPGLAVRSPAAGRVSYAGPFRNYGELVIIDHGHGWTSLVAGLARTSTELGSNLSQGTVIGRSGRQLLLELRHHGRPVDIVAMANALRG